MTCCGWCLPAAATRGGMRHSGWQPASGAGRRGGGPGAALWARQGEARRSSSGLLHVARQGPGRHPQLAGCACRPDASLRLQLGPPPQPALASTPPTLSRAGSHAARPGDARERRAGRPAAVRRVRAGGGARGGRWAGTAAASVAWAWPFAERPTPPPAPLQRALCIAARHSSFRRSLCSVAVRCCSTFVWACHGLLSLRCRRRHPDHLTGAALPGAVCGRRHAAQGVGCAAEGERALSAGPAGPLRSLGDPGLVAAGPLRCDRSSQRGRRGGSRRLAAGRVGRRSHACQATLVVLQPQAFSCHRALLPTALQLELVAEMARCGSAASSHSAAAGAADATAAPASHHAPRGAAGSVGGAADADPTAAENDSSLHNGTVSPAASVKSVAGSDLGRVSVGSEASWAS